METVYLHHPHQLKRKNMTPSVMALGYFDGVHIGHQQVINTAKSIAEERGLQSAVMTFHPHPRVILGHKPESPAITPLYKKEKVIEKLGIDTLYVVRFTKELAQLAPEQFIYQYIINLNVKHIVAGFDYTYGRFGKGTSETIELHSRGEFKSTIVEKVERNRTKISSTLIRKLIREGEVEKLPEFLGRHLQIEGMTAMQEKNRSNFDVLIKPIEGILIPEKGVYSVRLKINDKWYKGISTIYRKTDKHDQEIKPLIGINISNFEQDVFKERVTLEWQQRIPEKDGKFRLFQDSC